MTTFDTLFGVTGFPVLLDQFGEPVVVELPDGEERPIQAIVNRNPPTFLVDGVPIPDIQISVFNDPETGISSEELNRGTYRVRVSRVKGKPVSSLAANRLESDTGGVCVIRLQ